MQLNKDKNDNCGFTILHLSDLHVGMGSQDWMWPRFETIFLEDLKELHKESGSWDLVIFSGDLTQKSSKEEYTALTKILIKLWNLFSELGFTPSFFPVPGNHDLVRPDPLDPAAKVMANWFDDSNTQLAFWNNKPKNYRDLIDNAFINYTNWTNTLSAEGIPLADLTRGILPGDSSSILKSCNLTLGVIGLNSTWLQLGDGNYKGRMHIEPNQLLSITNNNTDEWCKKNDFNLLITHHPSDWLHNESLKIWKNEIFPRNRFDCHLFGHMHEPSTIVHSENNHTSKRYFQAASIFGLEKFQGTHQRTHGYSVLNFSKDENQRQIKQWPRRAEFGGDGALKLIPDFKFNINRDGFCTYHYTKNEEPTPNNTKNQTQPISLLSIPTPEKTLRAIRKPLPHNPAYLQVRRTEQDIGLTSLKENNSLWVVSYWGLGSEHFIRTLQDRLTINSENVFQINLQHYFSLNEIKKGINEQLNCSFDQLCELIAEQNTDCILILEDIPIKEGKDKETNELQHAIESLTAIMGSFCDRLKIIIKSRLSPSDSTIKIVELSPLDEADTSTYIRFHEKGGRDISANLSYQFYQHTDGIPTQIDQALANIKIFGVSALHSLNVDISGSTISTAKRSIGLRPIFDSMQKESDTAALRALNLLKALTMFPRGEKFSTVERFFPRTNCRHEDAIFLTSAGLVDPVEINNINTASSISDGGVLVVRREVRDYLYTILSKIEKTNLNKRALHIYFGENWATKGIKKRKESPFDKIHCAGWQIGNANIMILNNVHEAIESGDLSKIKESLSLATAYSAALLIGDHFKSLEAFCSETIQKFDTIDELKEDLYMLRSKYAKALRMNSKHTKSLATYNEILELTKSNSITDEILLNIALCHASLKNKKDAVNAAKAASNAKPKGNRELHARAIILENDEEILDTDRTSGLLKLEKEARARKQYVIVTNLALKRIKDSNNTKESISVLSEIANLAKTATDYNSTRATVALTRLKLKENGFLPEIDVLRLFDAYQYLHNENSSALFDDCHDVLWKHFDNIGQTHNLLRLFRYSSLIWRLRDRQSEELKYIKKLSTHLIETMTIDYYQADRDRNYYLSRASINPIEPSLTP